MPIEKTMIDIGFLHRADTGRGLMSFKRIFNRTGPTSGEGDLPRGLRRRIQGVIEDGRSREKPPQDLE